MAAHQVSQHRDGRGEPEAVSLDTRNGIGESRSLWLRAHEAARYVGCRSTRAFYEWRKRRGLTPVDGTYARRDLDRARLVPRKRHAMSPNSLANLRRHGQQSAASAVSASASASEAGGGR